MIALVYIKGDLILQRRSSISFAVRRNLLSFQDPGGVFERTWDAYINEGMNIRS